MARYGRGKGGDGLAVLASGAWIVTVGLWAADAARRRHALHRLHRRTVELLLNALTADDPDTAQHSRRVADLAYVLARAARLRGRPLRILRVAALLHDIGKIDDRFFDIVHSSSSLSRRERRRMKAHPGEGAHILAPLEGEHPGLTAIVCSHHEHWDGSGYPRGLRGEAIPLQARIIAIADAFDAMTRSRPYRDAMAVGDALRELRSDAGCQFDPRLVRIASRGGVRSAWGAIAAREY